MLRRALTDPAGEPVLDPSRPRPLVLAAIGAAACGLVGVQLTAEALSGTHSYLLAVDAAAAVAGLALLPFLIRRPVPSAALLGLLAAVSPVATPVATLGVFHVARWRLLTDAVLVAGIGISAHVLRGLHRPIPGLPFGWYVLLAIAVYATLVAWGAWHRSQRLLLDSLAERALRAEREQAARVAEGKAVERARLAREMHDVLAHRLTLLATCAGALEYRPDSSPEQLARAAGVVRSGIHEALQELRDVIGVLREHDDEASLRPPPTLVDLPRLLGECHQGGMVVELSTTADPSTVPATVSRAAYRVVQESLTNARRHAPGQPVRVRVSTEPSGALVVEAANPLAPTAARDRMPAGHGLVGLAERVTLLGGALHHGATGEEFTVRARIPT